jgi:hypothetical protein
MQVFETYRPSFMTHLFLSHLSRDNNSPKLVKQLFTKIAGETEIVVASRDKESKVYHIRNNQKKINRLRFAYSARHEGQLTLF